MRLCCIGSGYVGLVTGACLADFGMPVVNVDIDAAKIAALQRGEIPIFEPGLRSLLQKNVRGGRLEFTTELGPAVRAADAVFIAVGTPPHEDGSSDLQYVRQAAASIAGHLEGFTVIVTKSTVPVGTGRQIETIVEKTAPGADFAVASNPEFLREGSAIDDFLNPDRLVIGVECERARQIMLDIYSPLRVSDVPFVLTNIETSEMIKYASNSFLATKISFINEMAELCERVGADVETVARGMGLDRRIGPQFLHPGPGFGGSCFPKDTRSLAHIARSNEARSRIVEAVLEANDHVKARMIDKVDAALGGVEGATVAILGLAFKPETDDVRESPALTLIDGLRERGAKIRAYDPEAMEGLRDTWPDVDLTASVEQCVEEADAAVIVTEWNEFRALDLGQLRRLLRRPIVVDLRNIYDPGKMAEAGFEYTSIGRPQTVLAQESS